MDSLQAASSVLDVADIAGRTLRQLYKYKITWDSIPREVQHLEDTISKFRGLLNSAYQAGAVITGHDEPTSEMRKEIDAATTILDKLGIILDQIQLTTPSPPLDMSHFLLQASMKARWLKQREHVVDLTAELKSSHHQILARLALLNMYVSAIGHVFPSL